jgi:Lrp/AsnC family leucine-responsive transcriptional regulator
MDSLDRKIVSLLATDSSASIGELAETLDVPSSTLHQRIKKLETKGVITGYRATVNQREAGLTLHALVSLTPIDPARPDDIAELIAPIEEIERR